MISRSIISTYSGHIFLRRRKHLLLPTAHQRTLHLNTANIRHLSQSQPSGSREKRPMLPVADQRPFIARCDHYRIANVMPKARHFNFIKFAQAMPDFTDEDWKQHLSYLSHSGHFSLLPRNYSGEEVMWTALVYATEWLKKNLDSIDDVDYYHYLCFVRALMARYPEMATGKSVDVASLWFARNYASLDWSAFFEIFKQLTVICMRRGIKPAFEDDLLAKIIAHGTKLAESAEIYDCLCLLRCIDYYSLLEKRNGFDDQGRSVLPVLDLMAKRSAPSNRDDLESSVAILADFKKDRSILVSWRSLLRRGNAFHHHPAWNWLRYSIETVFDNEDLRILRPTAALVAVRAYKWKAIDFTPDDVDRFLQEASSLYLKTPGPGPQMLFVNEPGVMQHPAAFIHLVVAVISAADSDLPDLGKLSIRIDNRFWNDLVDTLKVESLKTYYNMSILRRLTRELVYVTMHLLIKERLLAFVERPFDDRRFDVVQKLAIDGRKRYRQRENYI